MTSDSSPLTPPMPEPTIGLTGYSGHDGNEIITVNRAGFDDVCIWGTQGWAEVERLTSEVQALREENGKLQQFAEAIVLENQDRQNSQANLRAKLEEAERTARIQADHAGEIEKDNLRLDATNVRLYSQRDAARADAERLADALDWYAKGCRECDGNGNAFVNPDDPELGGMRCPGCKRARAALAQHREGK